MSQKTVRHKSRGRRLTPEEAARYRALREQIEREKPEINRRHRKRMDAIAAVMAQLKASREAQGISLAQLRDRTGMDRSAISKLENGARINPTVGTLFRYAEALGKRLVVSLEDAE